MITIGEATFSVNLTDCDHSSGIYKVNVGNSQYTIILKPNPETADYMLKVHKDTYTADITPLTGTTARSYQPSIIAAPPESNNASLPQTSLIAQEITEPGTVTAPLPGRVLEVRVKEGDEIKRGDVLLVLEAMKMANEIRAPQSGTISTVHIQAGATVEKGQPMISIK